jgi:peptidyl-prolyl cis-trans isomerase SurA
MRIRRILFCITCITVALCTLPPLAVGALLVERIVAVVNDDIITLSELNTKLSPFAAKIKSSGYTADKERKLLYTVREQVLNQLIEETLAKQEVKRANINVSEMEIDAMIERLKESRFYTDEEFRAALKQQGLNMADYRTRLKEEIMRSKLVNLEVRSKIIITQDDLKTYYDNHADAYAGEKKYHLKNIIMVVPALADTIEKNEIHKKMETVVAKLKVGASFESLAREFSQSPLSKEGGDLGTFKAESLSPQIQSALQNLKNGEYTQILDTDQGFQIFYVENILSEKGRTLEEASGEIREALFKEIVDREFEKWLQGLRKKSHIKIIK